MSSEQIMFLLSGVTLESGGYINTEKYEPLFGSQA